MIRTGRGGAWGGVGDSGEVMGRLTRLQMPVYTARWTGLAGCEARRRVVSRAREATPVRERVTAEYQLSQPCLSRLPSPRSSASSRSSTEWTRLVLQTLKNYVIDST